MTAANIAANVMDASLGKKTTSTPTQPLWDETRKMRALTWQGKFEVEYSETPRPLIADPRDALIKVTASTICGSDLHLYDGAIPDMRSGDILGHECMGIVEEVGADVRKLAKGMRVVISFDIACGMCEFCQKGFYSCCDTTNDSKLMEQKFGHRTAALFGYSHLTGGVPGCQSEYLRVPFADVNCFPIWDNNLPDEKALYLSDIIPTSYFGVDAACVKEGSTVAVWGLGPVGMLICRWAQIRKASRIVGIDCIPERLNLAKSTLGIDIIDFKKTDVIKTLHEWFPTGVDSCIEAVGPEYAKSMTHKIERALYLETDQCDIITECIMSVKKTGTVTIIGAYGGLTNHFPIGALMEKAVTMNGGQCPVQKYWQACYHYLLTGEMDPTFIVSHKMSLADGPELYRQFYNKEGGIMKVFLRPEHKPISV
jgi:threonine dehydrogenase-like Zn-dependent dehydrogenase